jgi:hypothetical protein
MRAADEPSSRSRGGSKSPPEAPWETTPSISTPLLHGPSAAGQLEICTSRSGSRGARPSMRRLSCPPSSGRVRAGAALRRTALGEGAGEVGIEGAERTVARARVGRAHRDVSPRVRKPDPWEWGARGAEPIVPRGGDDRRGSGSRARAPRHARSSRSSNGARRGSAAALPEGEALRGRRPARPARGSSSATRAAPGARRVCLLVSRRDARANAAGRVPSGTPPA